MSVHDRPHRRHNPLTDEWVLVSPQRLNRPWQGRTEPPAIAQAPAYDPACYLCPGNLRAEHRRNPAYESTFVFDNDFPALTAGAIDAIDPEPSGSPLLVGRPERGVCRVVCFSPRHDLSLPALPLDAIERVVDTWIDEYRSLGARDWITYVEIFENRGAAMGASNPHPHGQIWANATIPVLPAREQQSLAAHRHAHGSCLLCDYLATERDRRERIVLANDAFTAIVPFWATWPFETLVLSNRHATGIDELGPAERRSLADLLKRLTMAYDRLFEAPCPYSMGFHQRPTDGEPHPEWHLHAHVYPPVLRSAAIHKFMVGYELLANAQRDITPEIAAEQLRTAMQVR